MRFGILLLSFLFTTVLMAQKPVAIYGFVKEDDSALEYAQVTVDEDGTRAVAVETSRRGRFDFEIRYDHVYIVTFKKEGYVPKIIEIDTREVPKDHQRFGHEYGGWEVTLFREITEVDLSPLSQPVARIFYEEDEGNFGFDYNYIRSVKPAVDAMEKEVKRVRKEQAKFLAGQTKEYESLVKAAQKDQSSGEYESALSNFEKAYEIRQEDAVRLSIKEVRDIIATNTAYQQFLADAKSAENADDLDKALDNMKGAKALKPGVQFPTIEIERLMAEIQRRRDEAREAELAAATEEKLAADEELYAKEQQKREEEAARKKAEEEAAKQAEEERQAQLKAERDSIKKAELAAIESGTGKLDLLDKKSEEFIMELAKVYPEGVTEEVIQMNSRTITKRIVVSGGRGFLYEFVKYNWGGEFFFKNGESVSKFVWDKETVLTRPSDE